MGLTTSEKAELATYQLRDVVQPWTSNGDNRPLRGGPTTWEVFKKSFLDRFFTREKREDKVVDFINFHQVGSLNYQNMILFRFSFVEIK